MKNMAMMTKAASATPPTAIPAIAPAGSELDLCALLELSGVTGEVDCAVAVDCAGDVDVAVVLAFYTVSVSIRSRPCQSGHIPPLKSTAASCLR